MGKFSEAVEKAAKNAERLATAMESIPQGGAVSGISSGGGGGSVPPTVFNTTVVVPPGNGQRDSRVRTIGTASNGGGGGGSMADKVLVKGIVSELQKLLGKSPSGVDMNIRSGTAG